jgi:hypothetical protein
MEAPPFPISRGLTDVLQMYARTGFWGLRIMAQRLLARIGQSLGTTPSIWPEPQSQLPNNWKQMTISADEGRRLEKITQLWPEFLEKTAAFFWILWNRDSSKEKGPERYRLAYGRDLDACPPVPVLRWETELLETAIHQSMNGLRAHLWKTGAWEPDAELLTLQKSLPRTSAHLGVYNSRIPRPAYPQPETLTSTHDALPLLDDVDPSFAGWLRIAYFERHWIKTKSNSYGPPEVVVSVYSGSVSGFQAKIPPGTLPFLRCDVDGWWTGGFLGPYQGPLVGMARIIDWLGEDFVFVPPACLMSKLHLVAPQVNAPLVWHDSAGIPAVRFRQWRVIDPQQLFTASSSHEGIDLIVRSDVFSELIAICRAPIREISVFRKDNA